jgi:hypothetical protein
MCCGLLLVQPGGSFGGMYGVDGGGKDKNDHAFIMNYALHNL